MKIYITILILFSFNSFAYNLKCPKGYESKKKIQSPGTEKRFCIGIKENKEIIDGPYILVRTHNTPQPNSKAAPQQLVEEQVLEKGFYSPTIDNIRAPQVLATYKYKGSSPVPYEEVHYMGNNIFVREYVKRKKGLELHTNCYQQKKSDYLTNLSPSVSDIFIDSDDTGYSNSYDGMYGYPHDIVEARNNYGTEKKVKFASEKEINSHYQPLLRKANEEYWKIRGETTGSLERGSDQKKRARNIYLAARDIKKKQRMLKKYRRRDIATFRASKKIQSREKINCATLSIMNSEFSEGNYQKDRKLYEKKNGYPEYLEGNSEGTFKK